MSSNQRGIFLVDADRAIATALREALVGTKLGLHWVSEIAAARRFLAAQRRCLVASAFVELDLPDGDGESLLPLVREQLGEIPIFCVSSGTSCARTIALQKLGVPYIAKPCEAFQLVSLLDDVFATEPIRSASSELDFVAPRIDAYCIERRLSPRQSAILRMYTRGMHDKEIAACLGCKTATVHEQRRRMGRKALGQQKTDAIADFHRFLFDKRTVGESKPPRSSSNAHGVLRLQW